MSGRSKFRKSDEACDAHFQALRRRLEEPPEPASDHRFEIYDFTPLEANRTVAAFNVLIVDWGLAVGRCLWRSHSDGSESAELPVGIDLADPGERAAFLQDLLDAARAYATRYIKQKEHDDD